MAKPFDQKYPENSWGNIPRFALPRKVEVDQSQYNVAEMYLVVLEGKYKGKQLPIQTVPDGIDFDGMPSWAVVPTVARNNPFYHYTGGEDKVEFQLDWYSTSPYSNDVMLRCRWVEALSKNDGYMNRPPRLMLIFGDLFKNSAWIVFSAKYTMSLFDRGNMMRPRQAYQDLSLRKVVDYNTTIENRIWDM